MYTGPNFKTKKALKEAVAAGKEVAPNTKGDHLFVSNHHDEDYACRMASVGDAPMSADTFFSEEEDDE